METYERSENGKESVGGNLGGQESRGAPVTGAGVLGRGGLGLRTGSPHGQPCLLSPSVRESQRGSSGREWSLPWLGRSGAPSCLPSLVQRRNGFSGGVATSLLREWPLSRCCCCCCSLSLMGRQVTAPLCWAAEACWGVAQGGCFFLDAALVRE